MDAGVCTGLPHTSDSCPCSACSAPGYIIHASSMQFEDACLRAREEVDAVEERKDDKRRLYRLVRNPRAPLAGLDEESQALVLTLRAKVRERGWGGASHSPSFMPVYAVGAVLAAGVCVVKCAF